LLENNELRKKIESYEAKHLAVIRNELIQQVEPIDELQFLGAQVEVNNGDSLKKLCLDLKADLTDYIVG
jgi:alanyl-tRNA synthetase